MGLLDVIVATTITGFLAVSLLQVHGSGARMAGDARVRAQAAYVAQQLQEEIKACPYYMIGNPAGSTESSITLAVDTDIQNLTGKLIAITSGSGRGQVRRISSYDNATKVASIDPVWDEIGETSTYLICDDGFMGIGMARGADLGWIALAAGESANVDAYNGYYIDIAGGAGAGQTRKVVDYTGAADPQHTAFIDTAWEVTPDQSSLYRLCRFDYEIRSVITGCGLKTVTATVFYQSGQGTQAVSLTADKLSHHRPEEEGSR